MAALELWGTVTLGKSLNLLKLLLYKMEVVTTSWGFGRLIEITYVKCLQRAHSKY